MTLSDLPAISINLEEVLIAAVLGTVIYLLEWLLFAKYRRKPVGTMLVKQAPGIDGDMAAIRGELARLHARLDLLEEQLTPRHEHEVAEATKDVATLSPYAQAAQLARQGVSAGDLSEHCGISRGEAELIVALNCPSR